MKALRSKGYFSIFAILSAACLGFMSAKAGEIAPRLRGALPLPGAINGLAISGSYAFAAIGTNGVAPIDLSNPASPRIAAALMTPGSANDLKIAGTLAFVADGDRGLQIIDISNPTALRIVGSLPMAACTEIALAGSAVYLLTGLDIAVIDAGDPTHPVERNRITGNYVKQISANNRVLCSVSFTASNPFARLYDLTDPYHPRQVSTLQPSVGLSSWDSFTDALILDDTLYLATQRYRDCCEYTYHFPIGTEGSIYDISNPQTPLYREGWSGAQGIWTSGEFIFSGGDAGFGIYEISPAGEFFTRAPVSDGKLTGGGVSYANHLFMASTNRLLIYELALPNPRSSSTTLDGLGVQDVVCQGNFAFAATREGLKVFDVQDTARPEVIGELPISFPQSVLVRSNYLYIAGSAGLDTIDIRDPRHPRLTSHLDAVLERIFFIGDRIYSCTPPNNSSLTGFDLADPSAPVLRWPHLFGAWQGEMLGVSRQYAFVLADYGSVYVIDTITAARANVGMGSGAVKACFTENRAYLTHDGSLTIFDITNVFQPKLLATLKPAEGIWGEFVLLGKYAYVSSGLSLTVVDISQETAPRIVAQNKSLAAYRASTDGRRLHIASNNDGYSIVEPYPQVWLRTSAPNSLILDGPPSLSGQVQRSSDLIQWQNWQPITFGDEPTILDLLDGQSQTFYRVLLAP